MIEDIIKKLKDQVNQCLKDGHKFSPLFHEVLHHLHLCKKETELFVVRHDILESLKERMFLVFDTNKKLVAEPFDEIQNVVVWKSQHLELDETTFSKKSQEIKAEYERIQESLDRFDCKFIHSGFFQNNDCDPDINMRELYTQLPKFKYFSRPVVLFGCSGSGKTALMAQVVKESQNWFPNSVSVVRFLGTSLLSFSIKDVLFSICAQIIAVYKMNIPSYIDLEKDYQFLVQFFQSLLWKIDTKDRPLVIILDSIDQLKDMNDAHAMHWLPVQLPLNVHIVISMIPSIHCCLENILSKMPHTEQYLEIPDMPVDMANDMITIRLRAQNRRITKIQRKFVLSKFENCPHPLYLRMILDQAAAWRSTTVTSDLSVGDDVTMAINKYFTSLERKHGEVTTQKTMGKLHFLCRI